MLIAVTAETDKGLDAPVAGHFGHAPFFVLVEASGKDISGAKVVANPFAQGHKPGEIPEFIHTQGANVMLSGGMGGRAIQFFTEYGIATATGATGSVRDSVTSYLQGTLFAAAPCAGSTAHGHGDC